MARIFLFLFVELMLVLHSHFGLGSEKCSSLFAEDQISAEFLLTRKPTVPTENSSYFLLDSHMAIIKKIHIRRERQLKSIYFKKGDLVVISDELPRRWVSETGKFVDLDNFFKVQASLEAAFTKRLGVSELHARELSLRVQKQIFKTSKINWRSFVLAMKKETLDFNTSSHVLEEAFNAIWSRVTLNREYDIPLLAGYSKNSPLKIYIDRSIQDHYRLDNNQESINVLKPLIIHESVEKSLIDELQIEEELYHRTHQIAQRLEMESVRLLGYSWRRYQWTLMRKLITDILNKPTRTIPHDLDQTANKTIFDEKEISKMVRKARLPELSDLQGKSNFEIADLGVLSMPLPNLLHFRFYDQRRMAKSLVRFQEHFESPMFKDKVFSRSEFRKWYKSNVPSIKNYYTFWDGFNFPGTVIQPFLAGKFPNLTLDERILIRMFKKIGDSDHIYFIGTTFDQDLKTLDHEIAHALYHLNHRYRSEIDSILSQYNLKDVEAWLSKKMGYEDSVLHDETHAWIMHTVETMEEEGFNTRPYQFLSKKLQQIFQRYRRTMP